jgi:hypothetical protein
MSYLKLLEHGVELIPGLGVHRILLLKTHVPYILDEPQHRIHRRPGDDVVAKHYALSAEKHTIGSVIE